MIRDRADIMQLTFFLGVKSAFDAWLHERRLLSTSMLPLICACVVMLGSIFVDVRVTVLLSAVLMIAMAALVVESSPHVEEKAPIYFSFFVSGGLILAFTALLTGAPALVYAPIAVIPIVAFFLFGGSSLVGLVRILEHV